MFQYSADEREGGELQICTLMYILVGWLDGLTT